MMLSASPNSMVKSSLEEMLESLRRRDECDKPKDLPPTLPARPTSRAPRLPSARKSLPVNFKVDGVEDNGGLVASEVKVKEEGKRRKELRSGSSKNSFGSKKLRKSVGNSDESPYVAEEEKKKKKTEEEAAVVPKVEEGKWNDNIDYFIKKKLRVWCPLPGGRWEQGTIQSNSGEEASVLLYSKNVVKVPIGELVPANPDILEGVDDLIQLSYLNEPSVLHNLGHRYTRDLIYVSKRESSKAGSVLIAVNPFKDIKIYGSDFVKAYRERANDSPHVYATADHAYNEMMRGGANQSIIISGESGTGKTETAKFAMQYLAGLGGGGDGIESEILQTNSILEAFGNAKTSRNNNSSRFGKLIEIYFSALGKISGAKIQTYLLEKSRVVQLANGERSYHIFYQLCAGAPSNLKERLNLKAASEYNYLNQSECLTICGVDDAKKFHKLVEALEIVKICKEDQEHAFSLLAAVLWLGNITFEVIDNENHVEVLENEAVSCAANLMGCSAEELMLALSTHKIQAIDTRDALAKFIYSSLFDLLVEKINESLAVGKQCTGRSINIVDIYGFESFKKNSFEQFCINYANERLQQHFIRHLFKLEQEDYETDGVDWTKVDFEDNDECLNLFEKKPLGLISLLDEECNFPKATDLTLANKLKQHLDKNPYFKGERGRAFTVRHYAGELSVSAVFCIQDAQPIAETGKPANTIPGQLFKLMNQLENTTPHFIRCIKPNSKQVPGEYEEYLVSQQLRCCGILEVVRISRSGYPTRMTHQDFSERYGCLLLDINVPQDPLSMSVAILQQFNILPEMYQIGYTKVYLRSGQIGVLENKRTHVMQAIIGVQKHFRAWKARFYFHKLRKGVTTVQTFVRSENARRKYDIMANEQLTAIICLQSVIRGSLARKHFNDMQKIQKSIPDNTKHKRKHSRKISETKDMSPRHLQVQGLPPVVAELQRRVIKAEATLGQKEQENAALREQVKQYEARWSEYEAKMKSMEDMWQKQMGSLQTSLAAARKSLAAENTAGHPGRVEATSPRFYDSEEASMGSHTPGGSTPIKFGNGIPYSGTTREVNAVNNLVKEFEYQRQNFDEDAKALEKVKTGHSGSHMNPEDEIRRLKLRFESWKKDYKMRLKESKARLHNMDKSRRKWWGKLSSRMSS
ncbi:hypothetical protein ACFE04_004999 [Oxalis oulophora]